MENIREQLKEEILILTDKQMDYVLKCLKELQDGEETTPKQQKEEARRYE